MAAAFPASVEEPGAREIAIVHADGAHGGPADGFDNAKERFGFGGIKFARGTAGVEAALPEDFVGHPVPDAGEARLHQERGLYGGGAMAAKERFHVRQCELRIEQGRWQLGPPRRCRFAEVEEDASELARVVEDQGVFGEVQDEMVVFCRRIWGLVGTRPSRFCGNGFELAGHAEVDSEPGVFGKAEEHLFAVGLGIKQLRASERGAEFGDINPAQNAFFRMQMDGNDPLVASRFPLFAVIFDFGQFGHGRINRKERRERKDKNLHSSRPRIGIVRCGTAN